MARFWARPAHRVCIMRGRTRRGVRMCVIRGRTHVYNDVYPRRKDSRDRPRFARPRALMGKGVRVCKALPGGARFFLRF